VIVVILFALFFDKKIKGDTKWTLEDKCSFGTFLFLSLIGGYLVTLLFIGLFIYLVIDFIRYNKE
jgi:hypothetical protein